jgi:BppU N-terminal domain
MTFEYKEFPLSLDLVEGTSAQSSNKKISLSQRDIGVSKILFSLTFRNVAYPIPAEAKVRLFIKRYNSGIVMQDQTAETGAHVVVTDADNGKIEVLLNSDSIANAGQAEAQIEIELAVGKIMTSQKFSFFIESALGANREIISGNDIPLLDRALEVGEKFLTTDLDAVVNITNDVEQVKTDVNNHSDDIEMFLGTGALGEKFPRLPNETDDTLRINRAITALNGSGKVVLTASSYKVLSTLVLPVNVSLEGKGHGPNTTVIDYEGVGFAIKAHSRSSVKNIRIDLNFSNSGILYGDDFAKLTSVPGLGAIDDVSISGLGLNQIGIYLNNASHVSMRKANMGYSSNNGIGLKIGADGYNSGVISGYDCVFGRIDANDVGLVIDGTSALDSFTFDGCYFGGKTATVQLGKTAAGVVRNATFTGCHYEQRNGAAVEIYNVRSINFIGMSIQGYSTLETAIAFKAGATIRDVNIMGVEANSVLTNIYKNEGATVLDECILKAASVTGGTSPTQYNGDFTTGNNIRFDIGKVRVKSLVLDSEYYLGSRKHDSSNNAPTTGTYAQGDRRINTQPTRTKNISQWVCVSSGSPGIWMAQGTGHGTTAERPSLTANDAGYSYVNTETNTRQYWTGSSWV